MQMFSYTARDDRGTSNSGVLEAASVNEVMQQLRAAGKYPISIKPVSAKGAGSSASISSRGIKISRNDVIQVSHQLSIMLETGVTLAEALECIASQSEKPVVKKLVEDLETSVHSGSDFSSALAKHPRSFPRVFVALMKAAERSGMLSKMLHRATAYLRDEQETLRRVKGALTYPGIMLTFAISTTVFLLTFVLPRFTAIYSRKGAALPTPTRILMASSNFLVGHWAALLLGLAATAILTYLYVSTATGARMFYRIQLRIPLMGAMFRKLHLSRGLRMIGTMAGAGVSLVDCVATARDLCNNVFFREMWEEVSTQIQAGKQMSDPLSRSNLVPRSVAQMIHSGEKSGKLAHVTEQVATFSEQELKETIADLTRYIEPAMIVIMGVIIGGVSLALMLPIFTISKVVSQ